MPYLPGEEGIIEECLVVFAIAHTYHVSAVTKNKLAPFQYFRKKIDENAHRILIERLLGLAAKVRFLDDQQGIVKLHNRKLRIIGECWIEEKSTPGIDIRTALNKLIHHKKISVRVEDIGMIVAGTGKDIGDLKIPEGSYNESHVVIQPEGEYRNQQWKCELDLFVLLNEILRIFHKAI